MEKIDEIIKGIWDDINDRKGFHFDSLDEDIQDEIKRNWRDILEKIFSSS